MLKFIFTILFINSNLQSTEGPHSFKNFLRRGKLPKFDNLDLKDSPFKKKESRYLDVNLNEIYENNFIYNLKKLR